MKSVALTKVKFKRAQVTVHFTLPWGAQGIMKALVEIFTEHEETLAKEIREIIEMRNNTERSGL